MVKKKTEGRGIPWWLLDAEGRPIAPPREQRLREVTIKTKIGGISLGRLDTEGRLVYLSGCWIPSTDPDEKDRYFRSRVAEIIEDGGALYKKELVKIIPEPWVDHKF
jgi:hypothetical protein